MSVDKKTLQILMSAVKAGNFEKVKSLTSNQMNSQEYYNLILQAISSSQIQIAKWLMNHEYKLLDILKENNEILHLAVAKGDSELVRLLVQGKCSTQIQDSNNIPPLFKLVNRFSGDQECSKILDCLLGNEVFINTKYQSRGFTILHYAAELGNHLIIPLLIEKKCHLNTKSKDGSTALHIAAKKGYSRIVSLLLKKGAKYNLVDFQRKAPLFSAIKSGDLKTFEVLLNCHSSLKNPSKSNDRLLQHHLVYAATEVGNAAMLKLLLRNGAQVNNHLLKFSESAIYLAVEKQYEAIVDLLQKNGACLDIEDEKGFNLLHLACERGSLRIVSILLKDGNFNLNARTKENSTALHIASREGHSQIVSLLLERGADCNLLDNNNKTPLTISIESIQGDGLTLKILLNHIRRTENASNNNRCSLLPEDRMLIDYQIKARKEKTEKSPLHSAIEEEDLPVVNLLLKYGAWVDSLDENQYTPLYLATRNGSLKIVTEILKSRSDPSSLFVTGDANGFTPLHVAVETENEDILELFLKTGISVNIPTHDGLKPLHIAIQKENITLIHLLLKYGADIDIPGRYNFDTPLFIAAVNGNSNIIEILSEASTKRSSNWIEGYMPLYIAAYHGHINVVKLFLNKGVDPNANPERYLTPLHAAAQNGHEEIVELLVERGAKINPKRKGSENNSAYISTPLLAASHAGHSRIIEFLLDNGANFNAKLKAMSEKSFPEAETVLLQGNFKKSEIALKGSIIGYTSLLFAVDAGNIEIVKLLSKHGASMNVDAANGARPLGSAIEKGDEVMVQHLLFSGANIFLDHKKESVFNIESLRNNARMAGLILKHGSSSSGYRYHINFCPLGLAIENELETCVENLLNAHADPNIEHKKDPVLHIAVKRKNSTIVKLLLKHGADINVSTKLNGTALSIAVNIGAAKIVRDLLEAGADTKLPCIPATLFHDLRFWIPEKCKPLIVAIVRKNAEIVELFLKKEPYDSYSEDDSPFRWALQKSSKDVVNKFIAYGASIHALDKNGKFPIFYAIAENNVEVAKLLLMKGAALNKPTKAGESLVHHALKSKCDSKTFQLIMDYGIDVNIKDDDGYSPLNIIMNSRNNDYSALLKLFLLNGADPNYVEVREGKTILESAIKAENPDLIKLLLLNGADVNVLNKKGKTPLETAIEHAVQRSSRYEEDVSYSIRIGSSNRELDNLDYDRRYIKNNSDDSNSDPPILPFRKIVRLLTQEVARLKAANKEIHHANEKSVESLFVRHYYERCEKEILEMTNIQFFNGVTYFDILVAKDSKLAAYARNKSIVNNLLSENLLLDLVPEYSEVLKDRIKIGRDREMLLESSHEPLKKALHYKFPLLIVEEIFSYLTSRDLRNLINTFKNDMFTD